LDKQKFISITALNKYQHYHDRDMTWFKWRADCVLSYDFMSLTPTARWVFIGLICLAIKSHNCIKYDLSFLTIALKTRRIEAHCLALEQRGMIAFVYKDASTIREDKIREEKKREDVRKEIQDSLTRGKTNSGYTGR